MGLSQLDLRLVVLQGLLVSRCTFQGIQIRVKLKVWEQQLSGIRRCCFVKATGCLLLLVFGVQFVLFVDVAVCVQAVLETL